MIKNQSLAALHGCLLVTLPHGLPMSHDHANNADISAQPKLSRQTLRFVTRLFRTLYLKYQPPKRTDQSATTTKQPINVVPGFGGDNKDSGLTSPFFTSSYHTLRP